MFSSMYSPVINRYIVSVLKHTAGCTASRVPNSIPEVYTNRTNHSLFTAQVQESLRDIFNIFYNGPRGNHPMYDDTGLTWDYSSLKIDAVINYVQRNAICIDDLLYTVVAHETFIPHAIRFVSVPENLIESVKSRENMLKSQFNIFMGTRSSDVNLTWQFPDHPNGLLLGKLKSHLTSLQ